MDYADFFRKATEEKPFPFQAALAAVSDLPEALCAPTGAGKTAAVVLAWVWRRLRAELGIRAATPRRLVYCLPMRVLVEQTVSEVHGWLTKLELADRIGIHVLMGGEDDGDWDLKPERDAVIIGTQDMLLSAALNRGFGTSRARWPMRHGLLNSDCLWVFDEVQLMGSGLATTAQLQAFRESMGSFGTCRSLWVSATLRRDWLGTVDFRARSEVLRPAELAKKDKAAADLRKRLEAPKKLQKAKADARDAASVAAFVSKVHVAGSLTLAVANTVARAVDLHEVLGQVYSPAKKNRRGRKAVLPPPGEAPEILLLHSRFRPGDRAATMARLLDKKLPESGRIVVATQVVEAGVDVSARTLVTELAPWPSLVQRLGRCNRYGEHSDSRAFWIDLKTKTDKDAAPYDKGELDAARKELVRVKDASPSGLEAHVRRLGDTRAGELFPYAPRHVVRRKDVVELFDTTPDLAGNDIDVSRFIRDGDDFDVLVFWRDVPEAEEPSTDNEPSREEICPVPVGQFRAWLKERRAYVWDFLDGRWRAAEARAVRPGQTFLIPADQGGYSPESGWSPNSCEPVIVLASAGKPSDSQDRDSRSSGPAQTIAGHTDEVVAELAAMTKGLGKELGLSGDHMEALSLAARWHDRGKAHGVFQQAARHDGKQGGALLAKAPSFGRYSRKGFRHELASALAMLQEGVPDLACYLAAAHHGKVRLSVRSLPGESRPEGDRRFARGVWDDDELPATDLGGERAPATTLSLEPMELGLSADGRPSWAERMLRLRDAPGLGPFRLAYLEALLRAADMRASAAHSRKEGSHA
jgi:CRISPR-associated endonuclease/helicase Cas3